MVISFACFAAIYGQNEALFGDFSILVVMAGILAGFITGLADARALKGSMVEETSVITRLILSIFFLIAAFIADSRSTNDSLRYVLILLSVGFSLSGFELFLASALRSQQFRLVTRSRVMVALALVPFALFPSVGNSYLIYGTAFIITTSLTAVIWLIARRDFRLPIDFSGRFALWKADGFYEKLLSLALRFTGSSPILLAALNSGSELAGEIFLAQRVLTTPIGITLNLVVFPRVITSRQPIGWLDAASLRRAFLFCCAIVVAGFFVIFSSNVITVGIISVILLVGSRIYCERLIYFFLDDRAKSSVWILWIALLDLLILCAFVLLSINNSVVPLWSASLVALVPTAILYMWIFKFCRDRRASEVNPCVTAHLM